MNHKTYNDVLAVITLQKPDEVIDQFISDYLTGVALAPVYAAEEEYERLQNQEDLPDIEEVEDEEGNVIMAAYSPNAERDARIAELEVEYPHLVEGERPVPEIDVPGFRREHFAQLRAAHYPPMEDYLDGVVKGDQGQIDAYVAACLAVKERFPK